MEDKDFNENEIIIENLNEFLTHISDMRKIIKEEERSEERRVGKECYS